MLSSADSNISDKEFVPLYDCYRSKNPDIGYQSYDVFDLENMNSADCKAEFRVEIKADLPRLFATFADISNSFKFLDYKKNLKKGLSSIGLYVLRCEMP